MRGKSKKSVENIEKKISASAWAKSVGLNSRSVFYCGSKLFAKQVKTASVWKAIMIKKGLIKAPKKTKAK